MLTRGFDGSTCFRWGQSLKKPHSHCTSTHAVKPSPARCWQRLALTGKQHRVSFIVGLLGFKNPNAVAREIPSIVIFPLNGVRSRWPFSHIPQKALKGFSPLPAYADASCAVIGKGGNARITTSGDDARPNSVIWGLGHSVGQPILSRSSLLSREASAALGLINKKGSPRNDFTVSTDAPTMPQVPVVLVSARELYNGPSTKYDPGKVWKCRHSTRLQEGAK